MPQPEAGPREAKRQRIAPPGIKLESATSAAGAVDTRRERLPSTGAAGEIPCVTATPDHIELPRDIHVRLWDNTITAKGTKPSTTVEDIGSLSRAQIINRIVAGLKIPENLQARLRESIVLKHGAQSGSSSTSKKEWTVVPIGPHLPAGSYRASLGPPHAVLETKSTYHTAEMVGTLHACSTRRDRRSV